LDEELYLLGSLEEMTVSTMMIVEGTENKRPGVLCEVEGPFIVINQDNNNDRWYTKSLIDNRILGIPYTKKMLANKTLYGEASHPSDRFDVKLPLISHNITNLWWNDDNTVLMGRADVLDTPSGRIIYTLVQYGSKIGISVRARGRLVNKGGKKIPDESVYQFKTFDFVPNPGFDEARMNRVDESVNDEDLAASFMEYVNGASVSELNCIQSIFESANEEMFGDVKKVIKERMSDNTLSQGNDSKDGSVTDILYEETIKNEERILDLEEQIGELQEKLSDAERGRDALCEEVSTLKNDVEQKSKDIEDISRRLITLSESESSYRQESERLSKRVGVLTSKLREYREDSISIAQKLEESEQLVVTLESRNFEAMQELNEAQEDLDSYQKRVKMLEEKSKPFEVADTSKKKKALPQGRSQVLNESVVDSPIITEKAVEGDCRRKNFIIQCSK
jgi:uncharacterized protein YoxC